MSKILPVKVYIINTWADLARKYKFLPYPRLKYRDSHWLKAIYEVFLERLVCPIKKHSWKFNSGNGIICLRCGCYARSRDIGNKK